jgi:glutaconate CoA-transferase subunit B
MIVRQNPRAFVDRVDFVTSLGFGQGKGDRERLGLRGRGPQLVITDLGVLRPDPDTCELTLTQLHPGVDLATATARTGWALKVSPDLVTTERPTDQELLALRTLTA